MIRVMIADDHTMFREGLRKVLEADASLEIMGETKDGIEVVTGIVSCCRVFFVRKCN
jgi:DNA-binding NarL/FixJ family response regulator